ncbi:MAG: DUF4932 domain-containing protein [Paludibacteraceae bacterium]
MMKAKLVLSLCIFCSLAAFPARHPYVKTEEGVELMELVARFAGNTVFNDSLAPRYQHDCDVFFAAWKNHPAVEWMRKQLPIYGIGYDAVPWLGTHLEWTHEGFVVIQHSDTHYRRWSKKALQEFLPLLSDFYRESNFAEFYRSHEDMYKTAIDAVRVNIAEYIDLEWFAQFFNAQQPVTFGIIVGLNNGGGSFGIERTRIGQTPEKIAVLLYAERNDGTPWYSRHSEEDKILVHEFCHSYILADKKYKKIGKQLLEKHRKTLNTMGYGTWENVIEESLVRASVIRYLIDHDYSDEEIREEIASQHQFYGFVWLPTEVEWYKNNDVLSLFDHKTNVDK